jgi:hypothetical protein
VLEIDGQQPTSFSRDFDHLVRLRDLDRDRFFDEDMRT